MLLFVVRRGVVATLLSAGAAGCAASPRSFVVDATVHDTTSILSTIEHRYVLAALSSRDAHVPDLSSVFAAKTPKHMR